MRYLDPVDLDAPAFSELYDELPLWSAPFGLWILDRVPLKSDLTILDVGAGTGFLTVELAERCGPHSRVIAVDPWAAAMHRLQRKLAQRRLGQVQLLLQDAASLSLADDSVDVIVSNLGVNNFDDPSAVMRVLGRVARPGATLLLTSNLVGHMAEFYEVFRSVLVQTGQHDCLPALERHIDHRATTTSLTRLIEDAGLRVTELTTQAFRMRFADGSALLNHHFIRLGFMDGWKAVVPVERHTQTFMHLEQALNDAAAQNGELALTVPMAGIVARKPAVDGS